VKKRLARAEPRQQADCYELLDWICTNPPGPGLPVKDDLPSTFSASFDEAVMMYQVLADHPVIWVSQITWLEDFTS
jgi:hypothetical protein